MCERAHARTYLGAAGVGGGKGFDVVYCAVDAHLVLGKLGHGDDLVFGGGDGCCGGRCAAA